MDESKKGEGGRLSVPLEPTPEQAAMLDTCCRATQETQNAAIFQRVHFGKPGRAFWYKQQSREVPTIKAAFGEFARVPSAVLQAALYDVECAFLRFFRTRQRRNYPRERGACLARWPQSNNSVRLERDGQALRLPGVGTVALGETVPSPPGAELRSVTVTERRGEWLAHLRYRPKREVPADGY